MAFRSSSPPEGGGDGGFPVFPGTRSLGDSRKIGSVPCGPHPLVALCPVMSGPLAVFRPGTLQPRR
ncbi:hypothetical protein HDA32_005531 [Spinactinospora alkalitolerans]|uniref:Uncharacterized protein n=1 Tax=Spinactinospora alkalitolerans TaxID=687207 RepID=A0A852U2P5_9ACTN|nr:hypothetical protein [Spinactinospora alkalitolerans]